MLGKDFWVGAPVFVLGLTSNAGQCLNGQMGHTEALGPERHGVRMPTGAFKALRHKNLQVLS